jgi:hypothetical protein
VPVDFYLRDLLLHIASCPVVWYVKGEYVTNVANDRLFLTAFPLHLYP